MDVERGKFYIGRAFDLEQAKVTAQPVLYDSEDLVTHAVVVGMTGSGKTGLCIDLLEEAALNGIPALMIDPKGDITNILLHFPELLPQDFQPWVNPDQARRDGKTVEQAAADVAKVWREGLGNWDIGPERIAALKNAAHFAVYTPGSDAGIPVSILASLKAPPIPWESNRELLREKISGTVTALLGLVGMNDIDPVRSREHILLSNIFESAWSQGHDLDLGELILQTQSPPFARLGVFDVNTFFPEKDRFELAMLLNNILAAPAFQTWIEGQPLDIANLLFGPDGRPRHSVFYIAHLSDPERVFFVTLLYSAVESWMRAQKGTSSLRAILYFDEIYGFMPPVSNPPSKQPMLRMLKQARAFGVGQVLVTQNPVDVDYKALSNAGTWLVGKLQTDQDKQRLLDGLQGALGGALDRSQYDRLISGLAKRLFLLHNVHNPAPLLLQTRWAMNFLAGPLTRAQIPALNELAGVELEPAAGASPVEASSTAILSDSGSAVGKEEVAGKSQPVAVAAAAAGSERASAEAERASAETERASAETEQPATGAEKTSAEALEAPQAGIVTRPTVPAGIAEYFLPNNLTASQALKASGRSLAGQTSELSLIYRPVLLAQAEVRFLNRKYNLDYVLQLAALVANPDRRGVVRWEETPAAPVNPQSLDSQPAPQTSFAPLEAPLTDDRTMKNLERDFTDWVYRTAQVKVKANQELNVYAGPEVSPAEFRKMCADSARKGRDEELRKVEDSFKKKMDSLQEKLSREERELASDQTELSERKMEELGTHAENFLSLFSKRRRRLSTSLTKRRLTEQAKADVEESLDSIADYKKQLSALEKDEAQAIQEVNDRWGQIANRVEEISVTPYKKDVRLDLFGVGWYPFHRLQAGDQAIELPGFSNP
jgi:hypothetical protein